MSGKGGGWRSIKPDGIYPILKGIIAMNKRVTIEIPDEMMKLVEEYAAEAGSAPDAYMREVIEQHLEDLHDIALAEAAMERLQNGEPTYTLEEVKQRLGLAD
ncbi:MULTISPECIES: type II toxin-antitoxin system RelB family antitoxin [Rhizobium]|uniref:type II toxin-antitoxin system RelB family antitoxin n=1 Tax=Rhizobium TaxID=379 RepID=UPI00289AE58C